jgi:glycosyltransferase involved in cell wall biosynthesis
LAKRVIIIGNNIYSMVRFRGSLIKHMIQQGHDVHLLVPDEPSVLGDYESCLAILLEIGAEVHIYPLRRAAMSPIYDLLTVYHFQKYIRKIRPDVVIAYMMKPVVFGLSVAFFLKVRRRFALLDGLGFAFTDRDTGKTPISVRVIRRLLKFALKHADHVIFLNNDDPKTLIGLAVLESKKSISVVNGTGLDLDYFDGPPASPQSSKILMISRLLRDKGVREFAAAARLVREQRPDARFILVGDADDAPGAIPISEVKTWDWLTYIGPAADVRVHLEDCLVYVLPSYREGRPRTVMEAMAMRRASIVTDVPGCRECIEHGVTGLVVPPQDPRALAAAILSYIDDPMLAVVHGSAARVVAETLFPEAVVNRAVMEAIGLT